MNITVSPSFFYSQQNKAKFGENLDSLKQKTKTDVLAVVEDVFKSLKPNEKSKLNKAQLLDEIGKRIDNLNEIRPNLSEKLAFASTGLNFGRKLVTIFSNSTSIEKQATYSGIVTLIDLTNGNVPGPQCEIFKRILAERIKSDYPNFEDVFLLRNPN